MDYVELQNIHERLLEAQRDHDVINDALSYITDVKRASKDISSNEQRDILRANLRYWAAYIFEKTNSYPDTELIPASPMTARFSLFQLLKKAGLPIIVILAAILLLSAIISGFIKLVNANQGSLLIYILYGIVLILIVTLLVIGRRLSYFASKRAEKLVENVRKTLIGGATRKAKPLATLKIIDGPAGMIGEELKIYTESVKLGRDPSRADMTFYSPDAVSSVSGLHCKIERVGGSWRIVALSSSGSETFVDDQPIPFNEPIALHSNAVVRMGYHAQRSVVFKFCSDDEMNIESAETRINGTTPVQGDLTKTEKPDDSSDADDIFAEFRDR